MKTIINDINKAIEILEKMKTDVYAPINFMRIRNIENILFGKSDANNMVSSVLKVLHLVGLFLFG